MPLSDILPFAQLFGGAYGYDKIQENLDANASSTATGLENATTAMTAAGTFQPYSVSSNMGNTAFDPATGVLSNTLSPNQQGQADTMQTGGNQMFANSLSMDPRFNNSFNQMQAMQATTNNRSRSAMGGFYDAKNNSANMDPRFSNIYSQGQRNQQNALGQGASAFGASNTTMQNSLQDRAGREQDIYSRMREMQRPGEERQRDTMNSGLFGSGRGGMTSSAYGGSPEQFAFGKAQAEARNQASMQAMGQAQTEMMNQANMASQYGNLSNQYGSQASQFGQLGLQGLTAGGNRQNQQANEAIQYGNLANSFSSQAGQFNQLGQSALTAGGNYQNQQAQMGNQMFQNQYMPNEQLMQFGNMGLQNSAQVNASGQNMAGLLAQMGIGAATTEVNFSNAESQNLVGLLRMLGGIGGGTP